MNEGLKPCPFCGSHSVRVATMRGTPRVICNDCGCQGAARMTEFHAIEVWNRRNLMENQRVIRAWHIGEHGEIFAASSEEEVRGYYRKMVGDAEAEECFACEFTELSPDELDVVFEAQRPTTLRQWAKEAEVWPAQISTTYN